MRNYLLYIGLFILWAFCLLTIFFSKSPMYSLAFFVFTFILVYYGTVFFLSLDGGDPPDDMVPIQQKESVKDKILRFAITVGFCSFMGFIFYEHSILVTGSGDKNFTTQIVYLVLCVLFSIGLPLWIAYSKQSKKENTVALTD